MPFAVGAAPDEKHCDYNVVAEQLVIINKLLYAGPDLCAVTCVLSKSELRHANEKVTICC